jgi:hypothetical protein
MVVGERAEQATAMATKPRSHVLVVLSNQSRAMLKHWTL